ncbi:MAG TPA: plasmid partitioning protein RepB C-terminal domain-containing protein [Rhizomicrobium sp.]|nr:plasmid partitioning protein RepB C-terminal domain-containing protein [Rhizomicrobium sp.]
MIPSTQQAEVRLIPLDHIKVTNPRARNRKVFKDITANIAEIGLKRPITVTQRDTPQGPRYDLVCGQGRLEAYQSLGQGSIPAFVIGVDEETSLVMSLVENFARRQHRAVDLLRDIGGMEQRGYSSEEIATKTGLSLDYVQAILHLLKAGETRLLSAVEAGHIPLTVAVEIAQSDDVGIQRVLQQAYESKQLRGRKLLYVKKLIARRKRKGKDFAESRKGGQPRPLSVNALLRVYRDDAEKKRVLIRKAERTRDRLIFVIEALRKLLADENFVTLMRAEKIDSLPRNLADRMNGAETEIA